MSDVSKEIVKLEKKVDNAFKLIRKNEGDIHVLREADIAFAKAIVEHP